MKITRRAALASMAACAQQVPDREFDPPLVDPKFALGQGPSIGIDDRHYNFHTVDGGYSTFARFLRKDGYVVRAAGTQQNVLVIANALSKENSRRWEAPYSPAFSDSEAREIAAWVKQGGSLLLVVDHQPFPACNNSLAAKFNVQFHDGYASDPERGRSPSVFSMSNGGLRPHTVTAGIDSVATFTGSAFQAPDAVALLVFGGNAVSSTFDRPGGARGKAVSITPVAGWLRGAALEFGRGRVVISGEAAMFSAQRAGAERTPMGMNHPAAANNARYLRQVMGWLARVS
ncbi:MAG: DUF4350 domain-containing protein [Acidobacteria bacterium]|nr:DUF4350 domain-containing protein [Acidobacteriota bacterium]